MNEGADDTGRPTGQFLSLLGQRVRVHRTALGWTVQELAERSGVSRRMLTQIELGQANPSLVTVDKVARALGTDFASLTIPVDDAPLAVRPPGTSPRVWESPRGSWAVLHQATRGRPSMELWEWRLERGDRYVAKPDPRGSEELFLVLSGTLVIDVVGEDSATLAPGASASLASDRAYTYANTGEEIVHFVRLVRLAP
jgi:transcriptional regulator with XRE-family HTH domain